MSQLKALGIDNILGFDWPASPSPESMIRALEVLYSLGVLDDDAKLTSPTGFQVAEIPLVCFWLAISYAPLIFLLCCSLQSFFASSSSMTCKLETSRQIYSSATLLWHFSPNTTPLPHSPIEALKKEIHHTRVMSEGIFTHLWKIK